MKRIALRAGRTDISDFGSGYVSLYSKIPMKRYSVVTRAPVILRSDEWQQLRLLWRRLLAGSLRKTWVVMCAINVTANAIADCASDQHVRQEVIPPREARHARRGC